MQKINNNYPMYAYPTNDSSCQNPNGMYIPKGIQLPAEDYDDEEDCYEADKLYFKSMYPDLCKRIQSIVDEECDKLDYDGSMMYDEYPSKEEIDKVVARIYIVVEKEVNQPKATQEVVSEDKTIESQQYVVPGRNPWLYDNVQVIFLDELFNRRRRRYPNRYNYFYPPYPNYSPYNNYYIYQPYQPYYPYNPYRPYVPYGYKY